MYVPRYGVGIECSRHKIDFEQTPCMAKIIWSTRRATHNTPILTNSACAGRSMLNSHELAINRFKCRGMTHTFPDIDDKAETYTYNISGCPGTCKGSFASMVMVGTKWQTGIADSEQNADFVDNNPAAFSKV